MDEKRYAILGDIHANIDALEVVLRDAAEQGVTDYMCVGDVVGYNAAPRECVDRIRALNAVTIRGNHDHYSASNASLDDFHPMAATVVDWTRRQLSGDQLAWLRSLPYVYTLPGIGGFMMVHGTLDQPQEWGYVFDALDAEASFSDQKFPLCFHGHTHVPIIFTRRGTTIEERRPVPTEELKIALGAKYFVNVGSVGQPRDGNPRASYCIYTPKDKTVRFRRLDYDVAAAQARIRAAGLPERLASRLAEGR